MTAPAPQLDTIVALASGGARAGVAVVRASGPGAGSLIKALTGQPLPRARRATLHRLKDDTGAPIDQALVLWFPRPHSFTGEDVAEFHVHGGPAVIAALLEALTAAGARLAQPGEFTRRAFEHGKLDLTAAEGLADLVDAETEGQRRQALAQLEGGLQRLYDGWREALIRLQALIEAEIDFPDEDIPGGLAAAAGPGIADLADAIGAHLEDAGRGERVREGFRIAILGPPNAGKSSLLNALARREAAIVSDIPGTTRDVVEIRIVLAGFAVWIADTAGLREAADAIEAEGVRRALARAEAADLRLAVLAPDTEDPVAEGMEALLRPGDLVVRAKADLGASASEPRLSVYPQIAVSSRTGEGLDALETALAARVSQTLAAREAPALTRARHRDALRAAHEALLRARGALGAPPELVGEDLRVAAQSLGRLTGRIDVEDILGEIFARFCIGK
jgi:tRNA modification GTPase